MQWVDIFHLLAHFSLSSDASLEVGTIVVALSEIQFFESVLFVVTYRCGTIKLRQVIKNLPAA